MNTAQSHLRPAGFARLNAAIEIANSECQIGISRARGGRRIPPYAFPEQGVGMLSARAAAPAVRTAQSGLLVGAFRVYIPPGKPAGPLPQGTLSLGGSFVSMGAAP